MKVFIFGDTHTGRYRIPEVTDASFMVWDWVLGHVNDVDMVIFLGDRCRNRDPEGVIRNIADEGLVRIAEKVPVIALCGNHDYYFKSGSLENNYGVLSKWSSIQIVKSSAIVEFNGVKCEFVSYGNTPSGQGDFLFIHDEVVGITGWAKSGLSSDTLKNYKKVYSGHIHQRIQNGNITYVGVPFQQGFGDGDLTGALILDLSTGQEHWIDGFGLRFVTGLKPDLTQCIVRVETEEQKEEALKRGAKWIEVIGSQESKVVEIVEASVNREGWNDWVKEYVDRYAGGSRLHQEVGVMLLEGGNV